jgi:hypothetical protein
MSANPQTATVASRYDHRTVFILNLLASNTSAALAQVAAMVPMTKGPPARDCVYSDRNILDRVWNRDSPTRFERQVAIKVLPRPHGREGWTACPHPRLDQIIEGRTVRQMISRGVLEADIRSAVKARWLVLGDRA